ncbi:MAG: recombination-associated protein RdgC [Steroidobacteraceae bacterium]
MQRLDLQPDEIQRHVQRGVEMKRLELAWQAHVQPLGAALDQFARVRKVDPMEQRLVEQFLEVVLAEPDERAVGHHRDCRIALRIRDQGFLAE